MSVCPRAWLGRESFRAPSSVLQGKISLLTAYPQRLGKAVCGWLAEPPSASWASRCCGVDTSRTGPGTRSESEVQNQPRKGCPASNRQTRGSAHGEVAARPHIKGILELTPFSGGVTELPLRTSQLAVTPVLQGCAWMHQQSGPSLSAGTSLWVLTRTPGGSPAPSAGHTACCPCSREAPGPLLAGFQLGHRRDLGWQVWLWVHPLRAPSPSSHRSCLRVPPRAALLPSPLLLTFTTTQPCRAPWQIRRDPEGHVMSTDSRKCSAQTPTDTNVPQRHQPRGPDPRPGGHKSLSGRSPRAGAADPGRSQAGGPPGPGRLRTHARAGSFSAPGSPWHVNQRLEALN